MSYTQQRFPNDEAEFPTPPTWLTWEGYRHWVRGQDVQDGKGQVRHLYTLSKAKKRISTLAGYSDGRFRIDWAIYEWTGQKYEVRYRGFTGDRKADYPLFQARLKNDGMVSPPRDIAEDEYAATIQSILGAS